MLTKQIKNTIILHQDDYNLNDTSKKLWAHGYIRGLYDGGSISKVQLKLLLNWMK